MRYYDARCNRYNQSSPMTGKPLNNAQIVDIYEFETHFNQRINVTSKISESEFSSRKRQAAGQQ